MKKVLLSLVLLAGCCPAVYTHLTYRVNKLDNGTCEYLVPARDNALPAFMSYMQQFYSIQMELQDVLLLDMRGYLVHYKPTMNVHDCPTPPMRDVE